MLDFIIHFLCDSFHNSIPLKTVICNIKCHMIVVVVGGGQKRPKKCHVSFEWPLIGLVDTLSSSKSWDKLCELSSLLNVWLPRNLQKNIYTQQTYNCYS